MKYTFYNYKLRKFTVFCMLFSFLIFSLIPYTGHANILASEEAVAFRQAIPIESNTILNWPTGPTTSARAAILMDANSGTILYAKNIHEILYPASTTKIMTALLALENASLNDVVTFSHDAVFSVPWDGSNIAIDVDEQLTIDQCLQAILIASANEVSNGVAEYISGDMDSFATLMTARAAELGCLNTNFVNSNGLHDDNHYTTAYDLALIMKAFVANELLCKVSTSTKLHFMPTDTQPDEIIAYNHNKLLPGGGYTYDSVVASKTGYTDNALSTLVTCAEQDNMRLICVVLEDLAPAQYTDTIALLNYGFENFSGINVSQNETSYNVGFDSLYDTTATIFNPSNFKISLDKSSSIILPNTITFEELTSRLNYVSGNPNVLANIDYYYGETYVGYGTILIENLETSSYPFDTNTEVETTAPPTTSNVIFINVLVVIAWVIGIAFLLILLIFIVHFFANYNFNTTRRNEWKKRRKKYRSTYQRQNSHTRKRMKRNRKRTRAPIKFDN